VSGDDTAAAPFEVLAPSATATPLVGHVPHASRRIPANVREELTLDDVELEAEIVRLTDSHTDALFDRLRGLGATLFVNRMSRLVFDPERFLDDAIEPAAAVGQGVVYTHGTRGQRIRPLTTRDRSDRIETLYRPYHAALAKLVGDTLDDFGACMIIDCHSFPSQPLPSELDQSTDRPDICLGTDAFHSPLPLVGLLEEAFRSGGLKVKRDTPFAGTFVPETYLGRDARVSSIMIEVRRSLYMDEASGAPNGGLDTTARAIGSALTDVLADYSSGGAGQRPW
jgi:N-formylglutamate deformylase